MNFIKLEKKYIDEIYDLQISHAHEFGNNIWSKKELLDLLKKKEFFSLICLLDKKISAFSIFLESNQTLDVYSLFVLPKYRNKGIASSMINSVIRHCKRNSINKIILEVNEKNIKAINFYKKKAFIKVGRRKNYYELGGNFYDAILMEIII